MHSIFVSQIDADDEEEIVLQENRAQAKVFAAAAECEALSYK